MSLTPTQIITARQVLGIAIIAALALARLHRDLGLF